MAPGQTRRRRVPAIEPPDPRLLADPVAFLEAEHYRQRAALLQLAGLRADANPDSRAPLARLLLGFFRSDLVRHVADEVADLLPVLRRRCGAEDEAEHVIASVLASHTRCATLAEPVMPELERISHREAPSAAFPAAVAAFVEALRRDLAWENEFVLALARRRLTPADRRRIGRAMAARRGIAPVRRGHSEE